MYFNFSLSTFIQVSTTIGSQLLNAPYSEHSSSLGRTLVRWVWVEEAMWHHSSVQIVGSRTGEFRDPRHDTHGEDFRDLTRHIQEPGGVRLQGSNRLNSSMWFGAVSTIIHCLALYAIMFIELCFNFMSVFLHVYPSCGQLIFSCLVSSLSCIILSQADLLEVSMTYLGSIGYFLARGQCC
jgi:hypothetical protein